MEADASRDSDAKYRGQRQIRRRVGPSHRDRQKHQAGLHDPSILMGGSFLPEERHHVGQAWFAVVEIMQRQKYR